MDIARTLMFVLMFGAAVILLEKLTGGITGTLKKQIPFA